MSERPSNLVVEQQFNRLKVLDSLVKEMTPDLAFQELIDNLLFRSNPGYPLVVDIHLIKRGKRNGQLWDLTMAAVGTRGFSDEDWRKYFVFGEPKRNVGDIAQHGLGGRLGVHYLAGPKTGLSIYSCRPGAEHARAVHLPDWREIVAGGSPVTIEVADAPSDARQRAYGFTSFTLESIKDASIPTTPTVLVGLLEKLGFTYARFILDKKLSIRFNQGGKSVDVLPIVPTIDPDGKYYFEESGIKVDARNDEGKLESVKYSLVCGTYDPSRRVVEETGRFGYYRDALGVDFAPSTREQLTETVTGPKLIVYYHKRGLAQQNHSPLGMKARAREFENLAVVVKLDDGAPSLDVLKRWTGDGRVSRALFTSIRGKIQPVLTRIAEDARTHAVPEKQKRVLESFRGKFMEIIQAMYPTPEALQKAFSLVEAQSTEDTNGLVYDRRSHSGGGSGSKSSDTRRPALSLPWTSRTGGSRSGSETRSGSRSEAGVGKSNFPISFDITDFGASHPPAHLTIGPDPEDPARMINVIQFNASSPLTKRAISLAEKGDVIGVVTLAAEAMFREQALQNARLRSRNVAATGKPGDESLFYQEELDRLMADFMKRFL